jgi:hypothetical protein
MAEKAKGEIVKAKAVKREPGYLYFVDAEGNVCRTKLKKRKKVEKATQ